MPTRIVTDANGRKHITNEPLLHPPQRTWVGLKDEEIREEVWEYFHTKDDGYYFVFARAIADLLKEKNTP